MDINTILLAMAAFTGGCILAFMTQQWPRKSRWGTLRRRIDTLVKLRVAQQLRYHEAECPLILRHEQLSTLYSMSTVKSQSHQMLMGFMMTYYPGFLKELADHTEGRLSDSEEHTCFLLKLGLRNKQIAQSIGITPNSVIKTKQRLRQKLVGAPEGEEMTRWIQQMGERLDKLPPGYMMFDEEETPGGKAGKPGQQSRE